MHGQGQDPVPAHPCAVAVGLWGMCVEGCAHVFGEGNGYLGARS